MHKNLTYGFELEVVDVDRSIKDKLPHHCTWNKKEITIVNSNGIAVDSTPSSKNFLGGEVNTPPTTTLEDQITIIRDLLKYLSPEAKVNYRCNHHVHIGLPPKMITVENLKKIQKYCFDNFEFIYELSGKPKTKSPEMEMRSWMAVCSIREVNISDWRQKFFMQAETMDEFKQCFYKNKEGKVGTVPTARAYINLYCIFKYGTIEFRPWNGTLNADHIENMFLFAIGFLERALSDKQEPVEKWWPKLGLELPKQLHFDRKLEDGFYATRKE